MPGDDTECDDYSFCTVVSGARKSGVKQAYAMSIALIIFYLRRKQVLRTSVAALFCCAMVASMATAQQQGLVDEEYQLAAGYYQKTAWSQSAVAFEEFVNRYPTHNRIEEAKFFLAESKIQLGNYSDALVGFQKFVETNPNHSLAPRATFRMGEAAFQLDKSEVALKSLELFVKKYPKNELVEYAMPYLGELRLEFDEPKLAQQSFATALRLFPDSEMADQNRYGLAESYLRLGKVNTAVRYWKFIAEENESKYAGLARLQMGMLECQEKNFDDAKSWLADALASIDADDVEHRIKATYWRGRIALEQGNFEEANTIFTGLNTLPADEDCGSGICYDAAVAAWKTDRNDLAVEWLAKLRSTWPKNRLGARAMALEIELLRQRGMDVIVLDYCQRFAERFSDDELRFNVAEIAGRTYHKQNKFSVGVETFTKLLNDHSEAHDGDTTAPEQRQRRATWLYLKGLCQIGVGDYDAAIRELRLAEANMLNPDDQPQIELAIATSLFRQQLYHDASVEFESFLEKASANDRANVFSALSRLVVCYGNLDRWEDADQVVNVLLEGHRETGLEAVQFLSDHAYEKQRYDIATRQYKNLADPKNDAKFRSQGLAGLSWLMMEADTEEANEVFHRLVTEYPNSEFSSRAAISRAKFLEEQNKPGQASRFYKAVVDRFPKFELAQIARLRLAWFHQEAGERDDLMKAKLLTEGFLEIAATNPKAGEFKSQALVGEALYQLGWIDSDLGNTEEAADAFAELVATQPESKYWPDAAWRLASGYVKQGDHENASAMVKKILGQPTVPAEIKIQTLYLQSKIAAATDRWDAVPDLMQELIDSSTDPTVITTAKYWKAEALYRYGDFDGAGVIFTELQPNAQQVGKSLEPWLLLRLAQCHGKSQRWTNAATIADDCLDRFNDFANVHEFTFLLGRAAEYDGMFDEARDRYRDVVVSPGGTGTETAAIAQWRIGETFFHQQKYKEAVAAYSKTDSDYEFAKWSGAALIQAGKCQEHLENWQHAEKLYSELLRRHPQSEFVADAKERLGRVSRLARVPVSTDTQTR